MKRAERRRSRGVSLAIAPAGAIALAVMVASPCVRADDEVDATTLRAEKLADEAVGRVARGEYKQAVELYLQANETAPASVFAFDIAWLYDNHLGLPALALDWYRRALAAPDATPEIRGRAESRIAALEAAHVAGPAPTTPSAPAPSASADGNANAAATSWSPLRTWALLAGGTGVVALGIGAAFAVVAKNKDDQAGRYCDGDRCTDPRALTLTNEARSAAAITNAAIVTGALFVATGVTLWLVAPRSGAVDVSVRASSATAGAPSIVLGGTLP